jgi:hypothetical protein
MRDKQSKPKIQSEVNHLVAHFQLQWRGPGFPLLTKWVQNNPIRLDDLSEAFLQRIEPSFEPEIDSWLEEELKMNLLAPIFILSELKEPEKIGVFYERAIVADIGDVRISVVADCVVSSVLGWAFPQTPYFFLQEFKKTQGDKQDPQGQMLAAMLAAQHLNQNGKPLYGAYVIGRDWFFTVLQGRDYARSEALRLTQPLELRQVIATLRELKQIILNDLMD